VLEPANVASLIGRIGNDVFPLGGYDYHAFATQLLLGMNDVPGNLRRKPGSARRRRLQRLDHPMR
jgi:hypothetical protein